ncbi:unnamed protein product [Mesocestoides corti]|uniref:Transposase n=1 Tax=Mesocestoides corti TaxID=53468 RepID=A0A0R3U2C6_MESCO|nr:unnamed protein product [Mesocestoides corti]
MLNATGGPFKTQALFVLAYGRMAGRARERPQPTPPPRLLHAPPPSISIITDCSPAGTRAVFDVAAAMTDLIALDQSDTDHD